MATRLEERYGSCRGIPAALLQETESGGRYPRWYIDFLTGRCFRDAKLHRLARTFLQLLADGKWHGSLSKKVSIPTIEACVKLGLVTERLTAASEQNGASWAKFQITDVGKRVLGRNRLLYSLDVN